VAGEHVFGLDVLGVPQAGLAPEALAAEPAMALLLEHVLAGRSRPALPSAEELGWYARLVERLDGLPLALTLIAQRLRMVKAQPLLAQLDAASGARLTALDAALALSWALLEPWEQAALSQCAVFVDGFTLGLAGEVISLGAWPDAPPLDVVLEGLTRRSLLVWRAGGGRWTMLLSVQRFALRQLDEAAREQLSARHTSAMAAAGRALTELCHGSAWHEAVERALVERANYAAAAARAQAAGDVRAWLHAGLGLGLVAYRGGDTQLQPLLAPLLRAVDEAGEAIDPEDRALLWRLVLDIEGVQWGLEPRRPLMERALSLGPLLSRELRVTLLWHAIEGALDTGQLEVAAAWSEEVEAALEGQGGGYLRARQRFSQGHALMQRGQFAQAVEVLDDAAAGWPAGVHVYELARVRLFRSHALQFLCDAERALADMAAARALFEQVGNYVSRAQAVRIYANYCVDEGRHEQAREAVAELLALGRRHGLSWAWGWGHLLLGQLELDVGRLEQGVAELDQAAQRFAANESPSFEVGAYIMGALGAWLLGDGAAARERTVRAEALRGAVRSAWGQGLLDVLGALGALEAGELRGAAALSGGGEHIEALRGVAAGMAASARWRAGKRAERRAARDAALVALASAAETRAFGMSVELRLFRTAWRRWLSGWLGGEARLAAELEDVGGEALLVDWSRLGYRTPGEPGWETLEGHAVTRRLLEALCEGEVLSTEVLCQRLWGEANAEAAQRLYVLVSALRRDGMQAVVEHVAEGYRLRAGLRVITAGQRAVTSL
jgi:tetratricopeptide (TPR) repeat protein